MSSFPYTPSETSPPNTTSFAKVFLPVIVWSVERVTKSEVSCIGIDCEAGTVFALDTSSAILTTCVLIALCDVLDETLWTLCMSDLKTLASLSSLSTTLITGSVSSPISMVIESIILYSYSILPLAAVLPIPKSSSYRGISIPSFIFTESACATLLSISKSNISSPPLFSRSSFVASAYSFWDAIST